MKAIAMKAIAMQRIFNVWPIVQPTTIYLAIPFVAAECILDI